jgi:hypothetical protein
MPTINVEFDEEEFKELSECKQDKTTWKDYILSSMWIQARLKTRPKNQFGIEGDLVEPVTFEKPCHDCGYCPYGQIVEMFTIKRDRDQYSCQVFGHNCPAFYLAEPLSETNYSGIPSLGDPKEEKA